MQYNVQRNEKSYFIETSNMKKRKRIYNYKLEEFNVNTSFNTDSHDIA